MSHVDEGTLAGYIDGQLPPSDRDAVDKHMAGCAECRTLLAEERRRAEYAQAILRTAGTRGSKTPSFNDVLQRSRVHSSRKSDTRRLSRLTSLAWAATIVIAVAVGWVARNLTLSSRGIDVPELERASGQGQLQNRPESATVTTNAAPTPAAVPGPAAGARAPAPSRRDLAVRNRTAEPARAKTTAPPREQQQLAQGAVSLDDRKENKSEPARDAVSPPAASEMPSGRDAAPQPAPAAPPAALRKSAEEAPLWIDTSEAEAARVLGRQPLTIPGLAVSSYSVAASGDGSIVVRQLLSPGNEIVLTERRSPQELTRGIAEGAGAARSNRSAAPSAARAQVDAFETREADGGVSVQRQGYSVTGRGSIPRDSIETLLRKVR